MSALSVIAQDFNLIPYRKELNEITGGVTATILLQQIIYWHGKAGGDFYKFIAPCNHEKYREGDSWTEELGFTRKEFLTAYAKLEKLGIVSKKIDQTRMTTYSMNAELVSELLANLYSQKGFTKMPKRDLPKSQKGFTKMPKGDLPKSQKGFTKMPKGDLPLYTETTTETTTDINALVADAPSAPMLLTPQPSNPKKSTITAKDLYLEFGVDEQVAQDWLTVRKAKKSPLTITALKTVMREAQKAGITLSAAIECSAEAGWVGFKADWYENRILSSLQSAKNSLPQANDGYTTSQASIDRLNDYSWAK